MTWLKCRAFIVAFHRENQGWSGTVSPHDERHLRLLIEIPLKPRFKAGRPQLLAPTFGRTEENLEAARGYLDYDLEVSDTPCHSELD